MTMSSGSLSALSMSETDERLTMTETGDESLHDGDGDGEDNSPSNSHHSTHLARRQSERKARRERRKKRKHVMVPVAEGVARDPLMVASALCDTAAGEAYRSVSTDVYADALSSPSRGLLHKLTLEAAARAAADAELASMADRSAAAAADARVALERAKTAARAIEAVEYARDEAERLRKIRVDEMAREIAHTHQREQEERRRTEELQRERVELEERMRRMIATREADEKDQVEQLTRTKEINQQHELRQQLLATSFNYPAQLGLPTMSDEIARTSPNGGPEVKKSSSTFTFPLVELPAPSLVSPPPLSSRLSLASAPSSRLTQLDADRALLAEFHRSRLDSERFAIANDTDRQHRDFHFMAETARLRRRLDELESTAELRTVTHSSATLDRQQFERQRAQQAELDRQKERDAFMAIERQAAEERLAALKQQAKAVEEKAESLVQRTSLSPIPLASEFKSPSLTQRDTLFVNPPVAVLPAPIFRSPTLTALPVAPLAQSIVSPSSSSSSIASPPPPPSTSGVTPLTSRHHQPLALNFDLPPGPLPVVSTVSPSNHQQSSTPVTQRINFNQPTPSPSRDSSMVHNPSFKTGSPSSVDYRRDPSMTTGMDHTPLTPSRIAAKSSVFNEPILLSPYIPPPSIPLSTRLHQSYGLSTLNSLESSTSRRTVDDVVISPPLIFASPNSTTAAVFASPLIPAASHVLSPALPTSSSTVAHGVSSSSNDRPSTVPKVPQTIRPILPHLMPPPLSASNTIVNDSLHSSIPPSLSPTTVDPLPPQVWSVDEDDEVEIEFE